MVDEKTIKEYAADMAMYYESTHGFVPAQFEKYLRNAVIKGEELAIRKWHKVADGDLPPHLTHVLNEKGNKVMYDACERTWQEYSDYYEDYIEAAQPVAWCEVPKFEEE